MKDDEIRILILEDNPTDAELVERELRKGGIVFCSKRVETREDFIRQLEEFNPQVILADYKLPAFDGITAFTIIKEKGLDVPFIMVSGTMGEDVAVETLKAGVTDYILKNNLSRLASAVNRALEETKNKIARKQAQKALRESEQRYRQMFDNMNNCVVVYEAIAEGDDFIIIDFNNASERVENVSRENVLEKSVLKVFPGVKEFGLFDVFQRVWKTGKSETFPLCLYKDSRISGWRENFVYKLSSGEVVAIYDDVTARKQAEEEAKLSAKLIHYLSKYANDFIILLDENFRFLQVNERTVDFYGYTQEELTGMHATQLRTTNTKEKFIAQIKDAQVSGKALFETVHQRKDGSTFPVEINLRAIDTEGTRLYQAVIRDITERKRAEEEIKDRENELASIYENAPLIMLLVDENWKIRKTNSFAAQFTGATPEDMVNMRCGAALQCIHSLDNPEGCGFGPSCEECALRLAILNTIKTGRNYSSEEIRMSFLAGENEVVVDFLLSTKKLIIKEQPLALVSLHDITERKRAEVRLQEKEERFREIFEHSGSGIAIYEAINNGEDFIYKKVNPAAAHIVGMSLENYIGRKMIELYPEGKWMHELLHEVWRTGVPIRIPTSHYKDKRIEFWIEGHLNRLTTGEVVHIFDDVTDQKRAAVEIRRLAEENAGIAEIGRIINSTLNLDDVYDHFAEEVKKLIFFDRIVITSIDATCRSATTSYVAGYDIPDRRPGDHFPLTGPMAERLLNQRSSILIQTDDKEEWINHYYLPLSTFQAGGRSLISVPLVSRDQVIAVLHFISFKLNAYTETDVNLSSRVGNQIAGAIANAQLFAEHERSENERISLQEQLRQSQKMEAIGRLAGGIAHDFNNLLTVISIQSQLALRGLQEGDPLKEKMRDIAQAADRAANLTRQLLAFSRRQILEMKVIKLNIIIKEMEKMLNRVIREDIELKVILADDLGMVKADPGQMEQVVMNLVVNAKDAMPQGGKLVLETANVELDEKYTRSHVGMIPGAYVMFSITDTGEGMTKEVIDQIFDPFFTTKEKGKGTGLGLSTVYGIVKQSGGEINVYSEPQKGTTFTIYLPRVFEPMEKLKKVVIGEMPRGKETILVVEDDPPVRKLVVDILKNQGYRVLEASEGGEALIMCEKEKGPIDLILSDIVMPHMSGSALIERLKQVRKDFKVLYMTGYTNETIDQHGVLDKEINLIHKPFTIEKLTRKVREVLDKISP